MEVEAIKDKKQSGKRREQQRQAPEGQIPVVPTLDELLERRDEQGTSGFILLT